MNILIVNDDGYQAEGLHLLVRALANFADVYVSAPKDHQSAKSHAITIRNRIETFFAQPIFGSKKTLVVDGTPADSVRLGLKVYDIDFDLVVSGINYGQNIAKDILYSGTVAAAYEAKVLGYHAIAVSAHNPRLPYLLDETIKLFESLFETKIYQDASILNINFPKSTFKSVKGVKVTKQGLRFQRATYVASERSNVFHIKSSLVNFEEEEYTDVMAFNEGYVSITPLTLDRTDFKRLRELEE